MKNIKNTFYNEFEKKKKRKVEREENGKFHKNTIVNEK